MSERVMQRLGTSVERLGLDDSQQDSTFNGGDSVSNEYGLHSPFNGVNNERCLHSPLRDVRADSDLLVAPDAEAYHREIMPDVFTYVSQDPKFHIQHRVTPQEAPPCSTTPSQPFRFLDLPLEIRLMIYELLVASRRRIQIDCIHASMGQGSERLKIYTAHKDIGWNQCTCYHLERSIWGSSRRSKFVSYDLHINKQQIAPEELISVKRAVVIQGRTRRKHDVRLLRTCRQVYYEARSVLYLRNTFEFICIAAFTIYFGLQAPDHLHIPRSTEPHRLRAIHSMTKVKVHISGSNQHRGFLFTSRLIRAGIGCLTSITSFELSLGTHDVTGAQIEPMMIDDSMFSKPPSLRRFVVAVREGKSCYDDLKTEHNQLDMAKELIRRILKEKDFSDTIECFLPLDYTSTSTESSSEDEESPLT